MGREETAVGLGDNSRHRCHRPSKEAPTCLPGPRNFVLEFGATKITSSDASARRPRPALGAFSALPTLLLGHFFHFLWSDQQTESEFFVLEPQLPPEEWVCRPKNAKTVAVPGLHWP